MKEKFNKLKNKIIEICKENENLIRLWIIITSFVSGASFLIADEIKRSTELEMYHNMLCIDASEYDEFIKAQKASKETYCKHDTSYNKLLASYVTNYENSMNKKYASDRENNNKVNY